RRTVRDEPRSAKVPLHDRPAPHGRDDSAGRQEGSERQILSESPAPREQQGYGDHAAQHDPHERRDKPAARPEYDPDEARQLDVAPAEAGPSEHRVAYPGHCEEQAARDQTAGHHEVDLAENPPGH